MAVIKSLDWEDETSNPPRTSLFPLTEKEKSDIERVILIMIGILIIIMGIGGKII